jgi:hypothetical protein
VLVRVGEEVQEVPRRLAAFGAIVLTVATALGSQSATAGLADENTVTISGRAYAFNHMDTYLAGATIRVRELPQLAATTDANGDYTLEVPDEATVTPYIEPPAGYNQIDLQTFHTRGEPIENANFQTPGDPEYNGLAALLSVPFGPDGRPEQCVIVTTASARNVRGVPYETFHERTPHGVAGATARTIPAVPGPVYFNESVIPDVTKTETSNDGGIIWTGVPAGTYRVVTESPTTRFASFLATCEPGRIVNANPPWGAYELSPGEKPLGAGVAAGSVLKVKAKRKAVKIKLDAAENLRARFDLRHRRDRLAKARAELAPGKTKVVLEANASGRAKLKVELTDAAGDTVTDRFKVRLPSPSGR